MSIRVYILAREINQPAEVVLSVAQRLGFDVKNQVSLVTPAEYAAIEQALRGLPPEEPPLGIPAGSGRAAPLQEQLANDYRHQRATQTPPLIAAKCSVPWFTELSTTSRVPGFRGPEILKTRRNFLHLMLNKWNKRERRERRIRRLVV